MKRKTFDFTFPLSKTATWAGQIKIFGNYAMEDGELIVEILSVQHSSEINPVESQWRFIPNTFWTWLENGSDRIGEIAYEHCKYLMQQDQPDTTTDMGQDHYCQTNNKLD